MPEYLEIVKLTGYILGSDLKCTSLTLLDKHNLPNFHSIQKKPVERSLFR